MHQHTIIWLSVIKCLTALYKVGLWEATVKNLIAHVYFVSRKSLCIVHRDLSVQTGEHNFFRSNKPR